MLQHSESFDSNLKPQLLWALKKVLCYDIYHDISTEFTLETYFILS